MRYIQAFFMSLTMFSAIPCPYRPWNENARRLMLVFLPLVGLIIGFLWYGAYLLLAWLNIPLQLQAAALMLFPYLITGFIHLDGIMDTADAILSRKPREDKLRILKDPHTGAFAVIAVAVLFALCYASSSSVVELEHLKKTLGIAAGYPMLSLIFIPVITRCCSSLAVLGGKPLDHSQYNENGRKRALAEIITVCIAGLSVILTAVALGAGMLIPEASYTVLLVLSGAVIAYAAAMLGAVRQLKGVSGDLAGYALTLAEAFALAVLALCS